MRKQKMNKIVSALFVLMLMVSLVFSVSAEEFDPSRLGSITITLRNQQDKLPVAGGEIALYKVADAKLADYNLAFAFTGDFRDCQLPIENYHIADFAQKIASYIEEHKIQGTAALTDGNGVAKFADLTQGLYMVAQTNAAEGFSAFAPFMVQLPITLDSQWVYDIDVTPKVDILRYTDITVQKVWNDDNGAGATQRPDSVKIQLLRGGKAVDTVTLSQENGWKHTWTHFVQRDDYSVKELDVPKGYKVTYKQNGFQFTVTNTATLVQTGQLSWPVPILVISGLVLIAAGYVLIQRGKCYE